MLTNQIKSAFHRNRDVEREKETERENERGEREGRINEVLTLTPVPPSFLKVSTMRLSQPRTSVAPVRKLDQRF